ncbi:hypothetical protein WJX77_011735 [Trebouxia sp. C0004]
MNCPRVRQDTLPGDQVSQEIMQHRVHKVAGAEVQAQWGLWGTEWGASCSTCAPLLASDSHDHPPADRPHVSALSLTS